MVAATQILVKVDVAGEGFRQFGGNPVGHVGRVGGAEKRALNFPERMTGRISADRLLAELKSSLLSPALTTTWCRRPDSATAADGRWLTRASTLRPGQAADHAGLARGGNKGLTIFGIDSQRCSRLGRVSPRPIRSSRQNRKHRCRWVPLPAVAVSTTVSCAIFRLPCRARCRKRRPRREMAMSPSARKMRFLKRFCELFIVGSLPEKLQG
jgi:hypothetical protein